MPLELRDSTPESGLTGLSREVVKLYARNFGRGPTKARTRLHDDEGVCVLEEILTRSELTLVSGGSHEQVEHLRRCVHGILKPELTDLIETMTERRVKLCVGAFDARANLAIEFFCFEPGEGLDA